MMKKLVYVLLLLSLYYVTNGQSLTLIKNGQTKYNIVIPENATVLEIQSGKVLQDYLFRMTGVTLPVVADNTGSSPEEILIGRVNRAEQSQVDYAQLKDDGLLIRTTGKKLILTGGKEKGIIYSVYTFLDQYLGCRKYTSDFTYVPRRKKIILPPVDDMQLPVFAYREVYYNDVYDPEFMNWHKLHSFEGRGGAKTQWGYWVHTFGSLLNPKDYGETHPEYFSYYDGKRHAGLMPSWDKKSTQPKLSYASVIPMCWR